MRGRPTLAVLLGLGAGALLLGHTAQAVRDVDYRELLAFRRLWTDWALGVTAYLDTSHPLPPERQAVRPWPEWPDTEAAYRRILLDKIRQDGLVPTQPFRTIKVEPFLRERGRPTGLRPDDPGRAALLGLGFRILGGPAPYLILWLGALVALPVLVWIAGEAVAAGWPVAGASFLLLVAASPFVVESLALTRYGVGFYLVGALLLVPLATYAALGRPTGRGLVVRALAAGAVFAVCALCRSGALFLLPGFGLALARGAWRAGAGGTGRRPARLAASVAALLAVFLLPFLIVRRPQRHETWAAIWEGLGDFDRTHGHAWSDPVAEDFVRARGAPGLTTPEAQAVLRRQVLSDVREDPAWYLGILARRLGATVTLRKLWPRISVDGLWMSRGTSANEAFMDKYWTYTTTVDFLGPPSARVELPVLLILLPTAALAGLAVWPRTASRIHPSSLWVVATVAAATLSLPVLVSTAGGQEPQAFAVTYALGAALLAEQAWRALVARRGQPRPGRLAAAVLAVAAVLAPAGVVAQPASASPHPAHDRAFWRSIAESGYKVPAGESADALVLEIVESLGSPDPEMRDDFAYSIPAAWVYRQRLVSDATRRALLEKLTANLRVGLGGTGTDTLFLRSFSALDLSILAALDNGQPFLSEGEFTRLLDAALGYLAGEKDLRAYDARHGWMHATAHTADLLKFLGRNPRLRTADQGRILDAVAAKLRDAGAVFTHGENERLAAAVQSLVLRADFDAAAFERFLADLVRPGEHLWDKGPLVDEVRYAAVQNAKDLLRSLYVGLAPRPATPSLDKARAAIVATVEKLS